MAATRTCAAVIFALAALGAPADARACSCRSTTLDEWCRESAIIAVVEVESVAPTEWPETFYMWARVLHATEGADLLADRMRLSIGGETSCDLRPWPVGARRRVFLHDADDRHLGYCAVRVESVADGEVLANPCSEESLAIARAEQDAREREWRARVYPRAGCASCAVGARRGSDHTLWLGMIAVAACVLRRRPTRGRALLIAACCTAIFV